MFLAKTALFSTKSRFFAHLVKYRRAKRNIDEELRLFRGLPEANYLRLHFVCLRLFRVCLSEAFFDKKTMAETCEAKLSTFTLNFQLINTMVYDSYTEKWAVFDQN